jgi:hypothetical protein
MRMGYFIGRTPAITCGEEETMSEPKNNAEPSGASGGYGGVALLRRACRKMGRELVSSDHFVCTAIAWFQESHREIRIEYRSGQWEIEPLDEDGQWTRKDSGSGLDLASALAWAVINKQ